MEHTCGRVEGFKIFFSPLAYDFSLAYFGLSTKSLVLAIKLFSFPYNLFQDLSSTAFTIYKKLSIYK